MNIDGIHPVTGPQGIEPSSAIRGAERIGEATETSDVVEMSEAAKLAAKVQELPEVRTELVEQVRAEIADGTYETPERIELTVDRLMEELFPEL